MNPEEISRITALEMHVTRAAHAHYIAEFLTAADYAYSSIAVFYVTVDEIQIRDVSHRWHWEMWLERWPEKQPDIASLILPSERLWVEKISISSPGSFRFLGKPAVLETIRKYLQDRHERKKDKEYRNAAEQQRLLLQNEMAAVEILAKRVQILKSMGYPEPAIRRILMGNVVEPLEKLGAFADDGYIDIKNTKPLPDSKHPKGN